MRKLSEINEGIFDNGIKRAHTGEVRKEDKSNLNELKPVDLYSDCPVFIADRDLIIGSQDKFNWDDVENKVIPLLKKSEWRMMIGLEEPEKIFLKRNYPNERRDDLEEIWKSYEYGKFINKETHQELYFPTNSKSTECYWCDWGKDDNKTNKNNKLNTARGFLVGDPIYYGTLVLPINNGKEKECKIRLVKDK